MGEENDNELAEMIKSLRAKLGLTQEHSRPRSA